MDFSSFFGGNRCDFPLLKLFDEGSCVVRLVGDDGLGSDFIEQWLCFSDVGPLSACQGKSHSLSRASVLRAITMNSSYELRQETETGSIEAGKMADLIILDHNIMKVPVEDISQTKVLLTMVGGKVVYSTGVIPLNPSPQRVFYIG
ncbi:amidohydrolase 3 [Acetobacter malorum]|uniref:Amidohydrolase 3 n=1 Tax=Acetobacter malorum TaxID=178901 RepID=A0A177G5D1_9PROT|nr:amidohydrolase 3 [Acetobacter malorum]